MYIGMLSALAIPMTLLAQERSWTERYPEEAAAANRACTAKEFVECRRHLLRLKELVDGRGDIIYRLAKVEASLGSVGAAIDRLSIYSRMGLQLADPTTDPAFAAALLREGIDTMLAGDVDIGNATVGFEKLGEATDTPPKSLFLSS